MAIQINWKLVSDRERLKMNRKKTSTKIIKTKKWELIIWSKIYYIWTSADQYRLYEWNIVKFKDNWLVEVKVMSRKIDDKKIWLTKIVKKSILKLNTK